MLGKYSLSFIFLSLKTCEVLGIMPWHWDRESYSLDLLTGGKTLFGWFPLKQLKFRILAVTVFAYFGFSVVRLLHTVITGGDSYQGIMVQLTLFGVSSLRVGIIYNTWQDPGAVAKYFTCFVQYERKLTSLYQRGKVRDATLPFILFFTVLASSEIPALTILYLADMKKSVYFGSLQFLIPKEYLAIRILAFILFLLFELFMVMVTVISCILYAFVFIMIFQSSIFWMNELKPDTLETSGGMEIDLTFESNLNSKTRGSLRKFQCAMNIYGGFQLLSAQFIACTKVAILTQHLGPIFLFILCPFSTIQFWGMHNFTSISNALSYLVFPGGVGIFGIWILLIQKLPANLYESSAELIAAWGRITFTLGGNERKIRTGTLSSLRTVSLPMGNFFYYRTSTMPNVVNMCVDQIVSLLIATE